jgi:hypothetical protein
LLHDYAKIFVNKPTRFDHGRGEIKQYTNVSPNVFITNDTIFVKSNKITKDSKRV